MTSDASWALGPGEDMAEGDHVELALPSRPELLFLVRMTAAAVASRADFGYDQIEDLRLAIDELCLTIAGEAASEGRLQLKFKWNDDSIEVVGLYEADDRHGPQRELGLARPANELSERILDALVDEHGADVVAGCPRAWLRMRRRSGMP